MLEETFQPYSNRGCKCRRKRKGDSSEYNWGRLASSWLSRIDGSAWDCQEWNFQCSWRLWFCSTLSGSRCWIWRSRTLLRREDNSFVNPAKLSLNIMKFFLCRWKEGVHCSSRLFRQMLCSTMPTHLDKPGTPVNKWTEGWTGFECKRRCLKPPAIRKGRSVVRAPSLPAFDALLFSQGNSWSYVFQYWDWSQVVESCCLLFVRCR